eukprot:m.135810 g.135810  ORF g.135810 m.135810 type:complete len:320 (-) comp10218_c0_seq1:348-1307(-)
MADKLTGHTGRVWKVRWFGKELVSSSSDATLRLWSHTGKSWHCHTVLEGPQHGTIRSANWSPDGTMIVAASFDKSACVWVKDVEDGSWECETSLDGHKNEVKDCGFSPSQEFIATCSRDKSVYVWEKFEDMEEYECCAILSEHTQDVKCICWHPSVDVLASGSYDNTICIYELDTASGDWEKTHHLVGHTSTVWGLSFNNDGTMLASVSDDKTIKIWKRMEGKWTCVCTSSGDHTRSIFDIDWNKERDVIATACGDNSVRVFNVVQSRENGESRIHLELAHTLNGHEQDVNSVAWCPSDPSLLASASDDETVIVWTIQD